MVVCQWMNVLPRSIERGSVTLFSTSVVLIFLRFKGTQNLGVYTYCSLGEQSRDITMWLYTDSFPCRLIEFRFSCRWRFWMDAFLYWLFWHRVILMSSPVVWLSFAVPFTHKWSRTFDSTTRSHALEYSMCLAWHSLWASTSGSVPVYASLSLAPGFSC